MHTIEISECAPQLNDMLAVLAAGEELLLLDAQRPIAKLLKLDSQAADTARGEQMARIMEQLAEANPFSEIDDPVAWQREIRKDRLLPGRE